MDLEKLYLIAKTPEKLYKYHKININLISLIVNNEVHLSKWHDLNDPMEFSLKINEEEIIGLFPSYMQDVLKSGPDPSGFLTMYNEENQTTKYREERICSFSEDGENLSMWAHYGDNHSGICLAWDYFYCDEFRPFIQKVEYLEEIYKPKSIHDIHYALSKKLKHWTTEKEWRLISKAEKIKFAGPSLVEATFGYKVSRQTINTIKSIFRNYNYPSIRYYKIDIQGSSFLKQPI